MNSNAAIETLRRADITEIEILPLADISEIEIETFRRADITETEILPLAAGLTHA